MLRHGEKHDTSGRQHDAKIPFALSLSKCAVARRTAL